MFKTVADQFVGQVSLFKVLSGTIAVDDRLVNTATGTEERLHGLFHLRGKEHLAATKVVAGDIAAVAKLSDTATGVHAGTEGLAGARRAPCSHRPPSSGWRCARSRSPTTTSSRAR